ncbi:NAD-P-binding protein [Sistotremastrum niveocremeum HHB9708]|uniref:NAD-P-binding protein n=2 Tax=Sistotremastraceae TaxID=3402574 RepID=A0A164V445_9AGAM
MARTSSPRVSPLRPSAAFEHDVRSPVDPPHHDAIHAGRVAVITGAGDGIGLAAARELAHVGMKLALADNNESKLKTVHTELVKLVGDANVISVVTDVSKLEDVQRLRDRVFETWGEVSVLLNNAGIGLKGGAFADRENWEKILNTNLWGVINVQHTFVPHMIHQENQSLIINTGSKQGITNPPGNAAYNASKAAVKSLTESLAHELRQSVTKLTAHLFVPGWTYTGIGGSSGELSQKPEGAWTATQTVQYMLLRVKAGQFYIICPDNETTPQLDALRIQWAADDIVNARPALSRWHPEYKPLFEEYVRDGLSQL